MQAEVLCTPFPGTVLSARATHEKCGPQGCVFEYRVRITNPTDRDANVQECEVASGTPLRVLPVEGIAGFAIPPHTTGTVRARFVLAIDKAASSQLIGQRLTCTGLDWHGNAPI